MSLNQKGAIKPNNEVIQRYMPLVRSIARKLSSKLPKHYDLEDLISDGVVGLLAATERFDPNRGVKFETFATYYIKGSILDNLPKVPVIKTPQKKNQDEEEKSEENSEEEYTESSDDENTDESSLLYNKITQMTYNYVLSLDAPTGSSDSEESYSLLNQVGKNDSIQNEIEFEELQNMLRLAIEQLPVQERTTLKYYYFHKMPFNEIGKKLGLSESWVSRIHKRALEQLRNKIGKKKSVDDFISPY